MFDYDFVKRAETIDNNFETIDEIYDYIKCLNMDSLKYEGYVLVDGENRIKLKCRLYEQRKVKSNCITDPNESKSKMINDIIDGHITGYSDKDINNILTIMNNMITNTRYILQFPELDKKEYFKIAKTEKFNHLMSIWYFKNKSMHITDFIKQLPIKDKLNLFGM